MRYRLSRGGFYRKEPEVSGLRDHGELDAKPRDTASTYFDQYHLLSLNYAASSITQSAVRRSAAEWQELLRSSQ
jgi:hypothetical protein